jgi:heme exporter protein D
MPNDYFSDYNYGDFFPSDRTKVNFTQYQIVDNLPKDLLITKGKWRLTIGRPAGVTPTTWNKSTQYFAYIDTDGQYQQKPYTVEGVTYDAVNDKLLVDINIIENPIPLFIVWGAVAVVVLVVGAITAKSILESVTKLAEDVTNDAIVKPVTKLGTQPIVWAVVAIFLLPVVSIFISKIK